MFLEVFGFFPKHLNIDVMNILVYFLVYGICFHN
jgi:hypothetical protein